MSSAAEIISLYEEAEACARKMLLSAREENWDELAAEEHKYTGCIERLKKVEHDFAGDAVFLERKAGLIRAILDMDAEIQTLTRHWMVELSEVLNSINADKKLKKTYEVSE